jgi:hypothetical protein
MLELLRGTTPPAKTGFQSEGAAGARECIGPSADIG